MQSVELIVNDISLDLDGKTNIALVLQAQDLGDISEKVGSFSRSFTIPVTEKNRRALENSFTFSAVTNFPYRKHRAVLKVNGLELPEGVVIIENDGLNRENIRLTFYTGNAPAFQLLKNTKLRSLCYYDAYHNWSIVATKNFCFYGNLLGNDKFLYPVIAYNNDTSDITAINSNIINLNFLLPALNLRYVISEIERAIGYTFEGELLNEALYQKLIFPYSNGDFIRDEYAQNRNNFSCYCNTPLNEAGNWFNFQFDDIRMCDTIDPALRASIGQSKAYSQTFNRVIPIVTWLYGGSSRNKLFFPDTGWYRIKRIHRWSMSNQNPAYFNYVYTTNSRNVTVVTTDVGSGAVWYGYNTQNGGIGTAGVNGDNDVYTQSYFETVIEGEYLINAHTFFRFGMFVPDSFTILSTYYEQEFITYTSSNVSNEKSVVLNKDGFSLGSTSLEPSVSQSLISPSMCLPDLTIGDFIKSIANIFGCIIFIDEINKKIRLNKFQSITNNIPNAIDWSNKVVNINNHTWNTRPSKLAQTNNYFYESLSTLNGKFFSLHKLVIDDETLPLEADVVKIPYSGSVTVERLNGEEIAEILLMDNDGVFINSEAKQRILIGDSARVNPFQGVQLIYTNPIGVDITLSNNSKIQFLYAYFNKTNTLPVGDPQLGWNEYLWDNYWSSFELITEDFKELNCEMLLNPVDVQTLNFEIPIYLQQYNSYFYIQKISDWTGEKPVKVELLKLN